MNKYIKKCLVVYSALALILVGMAGVTYAITATDADNYVTRSQYAVDMAYLQNKLDEQEAGLMGNINRYRSTDVKFVMYDYPEQPGFGNSKFNGGNYWLSPRANEGIARTLFRGVEGANNATGQQGKYRYVTLHRLWNGNYYISTDKIYSWTNSSGTVWYYGAGYNCAVPIENLPGYYLVIMFYGNQYNNLQTIVGMYKLDPNVSSLTNAQIQAAYPLKIRFKKNLWTYAGTNFNDANWPLNVTGTWATYREEQGGISPLNNAYTTNITASSNPDSITTRRYFDPDTGDYMVELTGIKEAYSYSNTSGGGSTYVYHYATNSSYFISIIPNDNVEYLMYGTSARNSNSIYSAVTPPNRTVTTGWNINDSMWSYEFVDCENGIKYFHGYKKSINNSSQIRTRGPFEWDYSLPIVY